MAPRAAAISLSTACVSLPKGVRLGDREADVEVLIDRALPLAHDRPCAAEGEVRAGLDEGPAVRRCQQRQYRGHRRAPHDRGPQPSRQGPRGASAARSVPHRLCPLLPRRVRSWWLPLWTHLPRPRRFPRDSFVAPATVPARATIAEAAPPCQSGALRYQPCRRWPQPYSPAAAAQAAAMRGGVRGWGQGWMSSESATRSSMSWPRPTTRCSPKKTSPRAR